MPTNYRDIVRLAKKHNWTLSPGSTTCYITLLARANNICGSFGPYLTMKDILRKNYRENSFKYRSIEAGFENWDKTDRNPRYYAIGQRLMKTFVGG